MKLSELKKHLSNAVSLHFELEDGSFVPEHFHVTEVGVVTRHYIDCGGTVRNEKVISFQLWDANDYDHRLKPGKLLDIIGLSEKVLGMEDLEVEVEYQAATIGRYGLDINGNNFVLLAKHTSCLAPDGCGIPQQKPRVSLSDFSRQSSCKPGGGCC